MVRTHYTKRSRAFCNYMRVALEPDEQGPPHARRVRITTERAVAPQACAKVASRPAWPLLPRRAMSTPGWRRLQWLRPLTCPLGGQPL